MLKILESLNQEGYRNIKLAGAGRHAQNIGPASL